METKFKISAVYYPYDSLVELTWKCIETGEVVTFTTQVDQKNSKAISNLIQSGIYHGAVLDRYKQLLIALEKIRKEAATVCPAYEVCDHDVCKANYTCWAIADKTLRKFKNIKEED